MCGGGGGGGGETKYNWNDTMGGYWGHQLEEARQLSDVPYQQYTGQRIANLNHDQNTAANAYRTFALNSGSPVTQSANGMLQLTLDDEYLAGNRTDPYANAQNQFSGMDNPHFSGMVDQQMTQLSENYQKAIAPQISSAAVRAGVFGGGDHEREIANSQAGLAKEMGNVAERMYNEQYNRSAGLEESFLGRGSQAFQNERGRQLGAVPLGQNEQALAFDRYQKLMGVGDMYRGYDQDILNQQYGDWQQQTNYPYTMNDWFTGILSRAQGGMSPNSSFTQSGYQANPFSQLLGAGLLGSGMGFF